MDIENLDLEKKSIKIYYENHYLKNSELEQKFQKLIKKDTDLEKIIYDSIDQNIDSRKHAKNQEISRFIMINEYKT